MEPLNRRSFLRLSAAGAVAGVSGISAQSGCGGGSGRSGPPNFSIGIRSSNLQSMSTAADSFMSLYGIPGMSVSLALNDKLVYSYGFGQESRKSVARIASVSKPITALTAAGLINTGQLSLTGTVFGSNGILGNAYAPYLASTSDWVQMITVRDLLTHTCGGWFENNPANSGFTDPAWDFPSDVTHEQLIASTVKTVPLQFVPGKHYAYSNMGYVILARVIEAATKSVVSKSYQQAAMDMVLSKCGVTTMTLASNQSQPNEVSYYEKYRGIPSGDTVARIDGAGGWVASTDDLVNLLMRADGYPAAPDIVPVSGSTVTLSTMTQPGIPGAPYGMGWQLASTVPPFIEWYHDGSQPGVSCFLQRTQDAQGNVTCAAINANSRHANIDGTYSVGPTQIQNCLNLIIGAMTG